MALALSLDPKDPLPLYAQLERGLKAAIATGALAEGDQLPTVRQLAVDLRVNANTVAKVYAELEHQGVVDTRRGIGTFIAGLPMTPMPKRQRTAELTALAERMLAEAVAAGFAPDDLVAQLQRIIPKFQEKSHGRR